MNDLNRNQILGLALRVGTQDIGPHWVAFEKRLGIMVFADSKDAAVARLRMAVDFTMDNIIDGEPANLHYLQSYLEKHGVEYVAKDDRPNDAKYMVEGVNFNDAEYVAKDSGPSWVVQYTVDPEETFVATG